MKGRVIATFYEWMVDNGIWNRYKANCRKRKPYRHAGKVCYKYPANIIPNSFDWPQSNEGYDFWHEVNIKWNHFVRRTNYSN